MKQRLGVIVGVLAAFLLGTFVVTGSASAAGEAGTTSSSAASTSNAVKKLQQRVRQANRRANVACKRVRRVRGVRGKARARKNCRTARQQVKRVRNRLRAHRNRIRARNRQRIYNQQFFDVCQRGCRYRTIQEGVDAAGKWKHSNPKRNAFVRVQPGTYVEGVLVHGKRPGYNFENLTIMGVTHDKKPNRANPRAVILEGENARTDMRASPYWQPGDAVYQPAQNAIDGISTVGLKLRHMWARNYETNTFFLHASNVKEDGEYCADYVMDNLVSSDTRAYGLFARNCFGGKMINSEGWGHGDSTVYIGETPCDSWEWSNKGDNPPPCQADPNWTLISNIKSWGNPLGFSGTNAKYVKIADSMWFNNGAGIVPNTLDSEKFEPTGDMIIENNDIFWNNYNYYQPGSGYNNVIGNGNPIGVGIMLYGGDGIISRNNNIFGHEKWGTASFSGPEAFGVNDGDDAKNMNNQFINNKMGRDGADPNAIDFFNDNSGGGNCWSGNTAAGGVSYAPGNGSVPLSTIYPQSCPQPKVLWKDAPSVDLAAGLQVNMAYLSPLEPWRDLTTIFGVAEVRPSQLQECGMTVVSHPPYTVDGVTYEAANAPRVTAQECEDLANR